MNPVESLAFNENKRVDSLSSLKGRAWHGSTGLDWHYEEVMQHVLQLLGNDPNLALISDGWTSQSGTPLINVTIYSKKYSKEFFWASIPVQSLKRGTEDRDSLCTLLKSIIKEIQASGGNAHISSVAGDNAPVVKAAIKKLRNDTKYTRLVGVGCDCHRLHLLTQSICDMFGDSVAKLTSVVSRVINRQKLQSLIFRQDHRVTRKMVGFVPTRWGSMYELCKRVHEHELALDTIWKKRNEEDVRLEREIRSTRAANRAGEDVSTITNDDLMNFFENSKASPIRDFAGALSRLLRGLSDAITHLEASKAALWELLPLTQALQKDFREWAQIEGSNEWHQSRLLFEESFHSRTVVDARGKSNKEEPKDRLAHALGDVLWERDTTNPLRKKEPYVTDLHHLAYTLAARPCPIKFLASTNREIAKLKEPDTDPGRSTAAAEDLRAHMASELGEKKFFDEFKTNLPEFTERHPCWTPSQVTAFEVLKEKWEEDIRAKKEVRSNVSWVIRQQKYYRLTNAYYRYWNADEQRETPRSLFVDERFKLFSDTAMRLYHVPCHSASVERANSCMKNIDSNTRQRLGKPKLRKLCFVAFNMPRLEGADKVQADMHLYLSDNLFVTNRIRDDDGKYLHDQLTREAIDSWEEEDGGIANLIEERVRQADEVRCAAERQTEIRENTIPGAVIGNLDEDEVDLAAPSSKNNDSDSDDDARTLAEKCATATSYKRYKRPRAH